jgi:hypothetical protein
MPEIYDGLFCASGLSIDRRARFHHTDTTRALGFVSSLKAIADHCKPGLQKIMPSWGTMEEQQICLFLTR